MSGPSGRASKVDPPSDPAKSTTTNSQTNRFKSKEVILALGATMEGQTTSHVIAEKIESFNVDVTRLAQGVPIGGEVHYLDENTLNAAFQSRKKI